MNTITLSCIARHIICGTMCLASLALPLASQTYSRLTLEQSTNLNVWQTIPVTPAMIDANGKLLMPAGAGEFYRMQMEVLTTAGILTQPAPVTINNGATTTLSVTPSGTGPFTYQWYQGAVGDTTTPVGPNATNFTTPALAETTNYWVHVTNTVGSVNSALVTVTVRGGSTAPADMVLIPAGDFQMGDNFAEGFSDERPIHTVNLSAFYIGKYEVTAALWHAVRTWGVNNGFNNLPVGLVGSFLGTLPPHTPSSEDEISSNYPIFGIEWHEAVMWCNARSLRDGLVPCYYLGGNVVRMITRNEEVTCNWSANGYRLPTEAEWEMAARGGLTGMRFPWGDTISHEQANYVSLSSLSYDVSQTRGFHPTYSFPPYLPEEGGSPGASPVGSLASNGFGLFDMSGSVSEWCWDWPEQYTSLPRVNPRGAIIGSIRAIRGGSRGDTAFFCRSAVRTSSGPIGFRVARSSEP